MGQWPGPRVPRRRGAVCSECGAGVFRHLLIDGDRAARVVVSAAPDKYGAGRVAAYRDVAGTWHARVLDPGQAPRWGERRHRPHLDECPDRLARRSRQTTAQSRRSKSDRAAAVSV